MVTVYVYIYCENILIISHVRVCFLVILLQKLARIKNYSNCQIYFITSSDNIKV